jgi:lysophospholipase L1-like esterase
MKAGRAIGLFIVLLPGALFLPATAAPHWAASWAASQQIPEPANSIAPADMTDATLRQIVHLSIGGRQLRVHLSNAFGTAPLHITAAHIARPVSPASAAIVAGSDTPLLFSGKADVTIPAGAEYVSDPVDFPVTPLSDLAVTIHYDVAPAQETGHPGSRSTSYLVHGDEVSQADLPGAKTCDHWYQLSAVDVAADAPVIVALGDSITDGHNAITNANDRWTDVLAKRLVAAHRNIAVINEGIGGNHLLTDGLGPNTLARFDRDVLTPVGVRYVILLEGINDLGKLGLEPTSTPADHEALVAGIIGAYQQIVLRAHAHGIKVIGATIMPFIGSQYYHPGPANEADRLAVNRWIRMPGNFDAVVDFDALMRDPSNPGLLAPDLGSSDNLHPTPLGYAAMGNAIPLSLFSPVRTKKTKAGE